MRNQHAIEKRECRCVVAGKDEFDGFVAVGDDGLHHLGSGAAIGIGHEGVLAVCLGCTRPAPTSARLQLERPDVMQMLVMAVTCDDNVERPPIVEMMTMEA